MERIIAPVIESVWRKVVASFSSRAGDQMADRALNSVQNIADFEPIFTNLKKNLKSLSAKAADVEEEIMNQERSGQKKRKREVKEWLEEVESIKQVVVELGSQIESEGFVTRLTDGGKAAQLNERVKELVEQSRNLDELVLDVCGTSGEAFLTRGLVGRAFGENLEKILGLLESGEVSSIGLYGMGGVGKTTLAQHINNRIKQHPERRVYWVTVSQEYTVTGLQDKIARLLGVDLSGEDEVGKRAMRLQTALSRQKSSVLILDDVWDNIGLLEVGCLSSLDGCKLIITTRSVGVCRQIGCQKEILVEKLDMGEAWKLFNERLGNEIELDPEVEGFAKSMVKLCGGLPLAIITVARTMRGKRGSHRWRNDFLELKERVKGHDGRGKDAVFEVLKFSFDKLEEGNDNSNEFNMKQLCFLYCSLYPEDYQIKRDDLVRNFISGGLLDERRSRIAQADQGHSILDDLVDVCLLESCVSDYDGEKCVNMHDLVRSMALRICKGKYLVRAGERSLKELPNVEEWTKDLEKVSFMRCGIRIIEGGVSPNCPNLSTLLLSENRALKVIPESFFSKMQGLCTLDLCWNIQIAMLPDSISDLKSLKSLLVEGCTALKIVPYLGKLKAMRELNLSDTAIEEVPAGLEKLLNLRFLSMNAHRLMSFSRGVFLGLRHLQHLNLPFCVQVNVKEIENLRELEEFGGGVENVSDFTWFIRTRRVYVYAIHVGSPLITRFRYGRILRGEDNELLLSGKNVSDEKNLLANGVASLTIKDCEGVSKWFENDLSELSDNPTSLKILKIEHCGGVEWILRSDDQGLSNTLEEIELGELDDLKEAVMLRERDGGPVFSSLKRLQILNCNKMRKVGLPVSALPNLEQLTIAWCGEVEEIFKEDEGRAAGCILKLKHLQLSYLPRLRKVGLPAASGVPKLEEISIESCGEIQEIFEDEEEDEGRASASNLTTILPKLGSLRLEDLPRLKRVSKATIISNSIKRIWIRGCPRLMKKFPLHVDVPPQPLHVDVPPLPTLLQHVRVDLEWWESLEWDNDPHLLELLQYFLHFEDEGEDGGREEEEEGEEEE